jgi:hypothetical protein
MYLYSKQFVELPVARAVVSYDVGNTLGLQPTCHRFRDLCSKVGGEQLTLEVKAMRLRHQALEIRDSLLDLSHCSCHGIGAAQCTIMGEVSTVKSCVTESTCHLSRTLTFKPRRTAGRQHKAVAIGGAAMGIADPKAAADEAKPAATAAAVLSSAADRTQMSAGGFDTHVQLCCVAYQHEA